MYKFEAIEVSLELAAALAPHLRHLARHNRDLADQLRRAAASIASNLAEGRRRNGKDRLHLFRIAEGSASEVHTQLRVAVAFDELEAAAIEPLLALADRLMAMCYVLTRRASA